MKLMTHLLVVFACGISTALANPFIYKQDKTNTHLKIEFLKNRGLHFEIINQMPALDRIWSSPMVLKNTLALDKKVVQTGKEIENNYFKVEVNTQSLCVSIYDKKQNWHMLSNCPFNTQAPWKGLTLDTIGTKNLYGLGQYFTNPGTADGDLVGRVWDPLAHTHGNALRSFSKGANSYAMFPVLYAMGEANKNFLFFYDNVYKQMWSFNQSPWNVQSYGDAMRWFVYTADDIKKLRRSYMQLTGKAPVPSKDVFGLWVSEFGYDNWDEVDWNLSQLRKQKIPVDGFALDIQWFGGDFYMGNVDRSGSRFGTLAFDETNFPNPKAKIQSYKDAGVRMMTIEESYVSKWLPEHQALASNNYMANWCGTTSPTELTSNPWWGIGGMIDWTNPHAGNYWHDYKRNALIEMGITHHWTDLGEPEMYHKDSCYYGFPELGKHEHTDVHNMYNFRWLESIARGYERNQTSHRPFMMSRSGTAGIQRFGSGFWSGDIGANMNALTAHYNAQLHMTFSGVDYYGADIGGFHRRHDTLDGNPEDLYTQWFANAALFDFPIRAHTWNLSNSLQTSPALIGHVASNRYNIRQRYQLMPYYYSLAHDAWKTGDAIIRPMALEFPTDLTVREMGNQKMIGPYLLAAMVASYGETQRDVYLPVGKWVNYHTGDFYQSNGETVNNIPAFQNDLFRLPIFVKESAIIPLMHVDDKTINIRGQRIDGSIDKQFKVLVVPGKASEFTLYEDDGQSIKYQQGRVAKILISQNKVKDLITIKIAKTVGRYQEMLKSRDYSIEVFTKKAIDEVAINGRPVKTFKKLSNNRYQIKLGNIAINKDKIVEIQLKDVVKTATVFFQCHNGNTQTGESIYLLGNIDSLGSGSVSKALQLNPSAYPTWTAVVSDIAVGSNIQWRCIKRKENNSTQVLHQSSNNNFSIKKAGYLGIQHNSL
jgi:alpha-glucosidase (family GH31 glycosyl hydrolase)